MIKPFSMSHAFLCLILVFTIFEQLNSNIFNKKNNNELVISDNLRSEKILHVPDQDFHESLSEPAESMLTTEMKSKNITSDGNKNTNETISSLGLSAFAAGKLLADEPVYINAEASGKKSDQSSIHKTNELNNSPLAGDYFVGLSLFKSITGRNITFERVVRKVMKEVYEPDERTDVNDKSRVQDQNSITADPVRKVIREVEEVTYQAMENGSKYKGSLFASKKEYPLLSGDASGGVYATITAAINDLNARGVSAAVRFLLVDGSYTSATESYPLIINSIAGSSDTNTIVIKPNTGVTSVISGNTSNSIFKLNGADYVTIDGSDSGGTNRNLTIIDSNAAGIGIWIASASASNGAMFNTVKNCKIRGLSHITTFAGIFSGSGTSFGSEAETPNSNLSIQNNEITRMQNAVYLRGNSISYDTAMNISGNTFGTASSNLGYRGIYISNSRNFRIYDNIISGVISSPSSTATMQGIQVGENIDGGSIFKNKISNIKQINISVGWGAAGLFLGAATTASELSVYNNFIFNVTGYGFPGTSFIDNGYGIMVESGGGYNLYFNTISMNTNQTNSNGIPAALNVSSSVVSTNSINLRNNIFSNTQTVGSNRYCIYSGAAASVYSDINYNDYYFASNPNLGFLGSNLSSLSGWRTATGDDMNSISTNPKFISNTDLHIDTNSVSFCNAAGVSIPGISNDIDGNIRDVLVPDIGADEFYVQPLAGDYTIGVSLFNSITGRNITFERIVRKVMKEDFESPEVKEGRKNSIVREQIVMKEVEEVIFVPMENGMRYEGSLFASRVEYPNLQADAGSGVYATITSAAADLNYKGVSAPVRFLLLDANYTSATETFPVTINTVYGASEINTVTFRPASSVTSTISGNSANGIFKLNGADYIIIDGSNSGSNDRSLTILDSNSSGVGIWIASASVSNGAMYNTIKNCRIKGLSQFTSFAGIVSGSGTVFSNEAEAQNSNLSILNNEITRVQNAVFLKGNSISYDSAVSISGNTFGTTPENLGLRGIYIGNSRKFRIYNNNISGVISSSSSTETMSGIHAALNIEEGNIFNNKINNIKQINSDGRSSAGILLDAFTTVSNISVYNNFIYDVTGYGDTVLNENGFGIFLNAGGGYKLYYNTVSMNTNQTNPNGITAALYVSGNLAVSNSLNIRNNIFANIQTTGTNRYSIYSGAAASVYADIDFNDFYFSSNPNLGYLGGNQTTLSDWRTATGKDFSSISGNPMFVSSSDLHIDLSSTSPCNAAGVSIEGITDDIDGNTRDISSPDIGADEFDPGALAGDYFVGISMFNSLTGRNITFDRVVRTVMKEVYEPSQETDKSDKSKVQDMTSLSYIPMRKIMQEAEEVTYIPMENGRRYEGPLFALQENYPKLQSDLAGGVYATITAAVADLNSRGVSAAVRFLLVDSIYTSATESYPLIINSITGASAVNTVTIRPNDGISSTISGNSEEGIFKLNGADFLTIDGSNSDSTDKSLTMIDSNSTGAGIWIASVSDSNGATFNTIKNCRISGLSQFTTFAGIFSGSSSALENESGSPNSNLTILNNEITKVQNAIYLRGSSASLDTGVMVSGNIFGTISEYLGFRGIYIGNSRNFRIYDNIISGVISSVSSAATVHGIQIGNNIEGGSIYKNKIYNIKQTNSLIGWGASGILLGAVNTSANVSVYNNFISDVTAYGYPDVNSYDNGYGIMVESGGGYSIYFNTVSMNTNQTNPNGITAALNISALVNAANSIDIRNNIFSNTQTAGINRYCIYSGTDASVYAEINYNDYYFAGNPNLGYLGGNQPDLVSWQIATGDDSSSISENPLFVSNADLHIDSAAVSPCNASGVTITGISEDIDGDERSITPDIGADEFDFSHNDVGVTEIVYPNEGINIILSDTIVPAARIKNFGTENQTSPFDITCIINPGGYSSTVSDTLSAGAERTITFADGFMPIANTVYTITVYTNLAGDINSSNDTLIQTSTFIDVKPVIESFSPESGPVGTLVTISGRGFNNIPTSNIVYFGAEVADVMSASQDSLTVSVPAGTNFENLSVTNLDSNLTGYSSKPFIVTFTGGCKIDFASFVNFPTGLNPTDVKAGDIDKDGKPDIVTANKSGNSISVYRNISDTEAINFDTKIDLSTGGAEPEALSIEDIDGDGKLDIIVSGNLISFFRNTSDTGIISFDARTDIPIPGRASDNLVCDLDDDGKPDIIFAAVDSLIVYRNVSSGSAINFIPTHDYHSVNGNFILESADIDGDGRKDILAYSGSNSLIFKNTSGYGNISLIKINFPLPGDTMVINQIKSGDMDGDGKPDIVFSSSQTDNITVYKNTSIPGNISFDSPYDFILAGDGGTTTIGDFDGDGKPDIASGSGTSVHLIRNTSFPGSINFSGYVNYPAPENIFMNNVDLDGDGKSELVTANPDDTTVSVFRNLTSPAILQTVVFGNGNIILNGSTIPDTANHTDFGIVPADSSGVRIYFLINNSTDSLSVNSISMTGGDSILFTADTLILSEKIAPGDSAAFAITFTPLDSGVKTSTVKINSAINSGTECLLEQTYTFTVQGTGSSPGIINITVIQEGFYDAGEDKLRMKDTVRAFLHSNVSPYEVIDSAVGLIDSLSFTGSFIFANAPGGTYYIKVKHRNSIETWSKSGGEIFSVGSTMNYDFTSTASQALGSNQKQIASFSNVNAQTKNIAQKDAATVRFGIYSGDVNQDGIIEAADLSSVDNDAGNFLSGYVTSDVNGDGIVEGSDLAITDNNAANFVSAVLP